MVIPSRKFRANDIVVSDVNTDEKIPNNQGIMLDTEKNLSLQNVLQSLCDDNRRGVIYLLSGIKLDGYFCAYDDEVIMLESLDRDNTQMVYQHTIATLYPVDDD